MRRFGVLLGCLFLIVACGAPGGDDSGAGSDSRGGETEAVTGEFLPCPFTAEEIRDEWVVGFRVHMRRIAGGAEQVERWTVVSADAEGLEIESATLDEAGKIAGEPSVARSTWEELRDHAKFASARAKREKATRDTPLGMFEGWSYDVREEDGSVSEYFFATEKPGAPMEMRTMRGEEVVTELAQIARYRPPSS